MLASGFNAEYFNPSERVLTSKKQLEKAPKGRNVIACGNATGQRYRFVRQALKGRNTITPLQGLR
jgi:hypothetical protein